MSLCHSSLYVCFATVSMYIVKSTPLRVFNESFQYFEDILKMCMKKFETEKIILTILQGLELGHIPTPLHIK